VIADTGTARLGEGGVGHLVHADGARGRAVDGEGIPAQAPAPVGARQRIAGALDLRQRRQQLGRDGSGGVLAEERPVFRPGRGRRLGEHAGDREEHLRRLAHDLIGEVRRRAERQDRRDDHGDAQGTGRGVQLPPRPERALAPAAEAAPAAAPAPAAERQVAGG
jgi:hypothetical protein